MVEPLKEAATALKAQGTVVMAIDGQARRTAPHRRRTLELQRRSCSGGAAIVEL